MIKSVLLVLLSVSWSCSYPDGAPQKSCSDMFPHHKKDARTSPSPFATLTNQSIISQHESVEVHLTSIDGPSFTGFMTMAFDQSNGWGPIGTFRALESSKVLSCSHGLPNAVTHTNSHKKMNVKLIWTPPQGFQGSVLFKTTFVQSKKTFWVQVPSSVLNVTIAN